MKYSELIQFDPIESVIQLRDASKKEEAKKLVSTFVISKEMTDKMINLIFTHLQFDKVADNKGLFIVGNYGTGKSHLLSVISAVAEHKELSELLNNKDVALAADKSIAGKFKVFRTEIGGTDRSLRDIVVAELEQQLKEIDVKYKFPKAKDITNNKAAFEEMMMAFGEKYPEDGLILIVDELLDYLGGRNEHQIIKDLAILREIGEVCKDIRFRFIVGIQEMLFDNPRFQFVADSIRRVQDRFEQVLIARSDVKYVVSNRLLKKNTQQYSKIKEYLSPFTKFYGDMNEKLDEYIQLFPIHPDYIETFERMTVVEKREVLKTLSRSMKDLLKNEVPEDVPAIISYDEYWNKLIDNASFRALPSVKEVIDCSKVLESKIKQSFTRKQYKTIALRIIHALSIHRLTTGDINAPIGLTAEELRDSLCLFDPLVAEMGGEPAEDLKGLVETVLKEIHKTVNGQFLSHNKDNNQYYLDLKKTEDYDAIIEKKAETLSNNTLDIYYFEALKQAMELSDSTYVTNYRIWEYDLEWFDKKAVRLGYLFFGAPNERSTAQPPRDFYIYILQPFDKPSYKEEKKADEVFFTLAKIEGALKDDISFYAAASELARSSSGNSRSVYESKAIQYLKSLVRYLREHITTIYNITYQGKEKPLKEYLIEGRARHSGTLDNIRDIVRSVSSTCLNNYFNDLAPEYPVFDITISRNNIQQAAEDAIRWIRGATQTKQGAAVLEALELLDGDKVVTSGSKYANYILDLLNAKPSGQVVNRSEIIKDDNEVGFMAPERFRLEPEWVAVILAAMVYYGNIGLAITGQKFFANDYDNLAATSIKDLVRFKHIEKPKDWDIPALTALFQLLGLAPGLAQLVAQNKDEPVQQLQKSVEELLNKLVVVIQNLQSGLFFWSKSVLGDNEKDEYLVQLKELKEFLESIRPFNTPGKLKNLKHSESSINVYANHIEILKNVRSISDLVNELSPFASYLAQAERMMPNENKWLMKMRRERQNILNQINDPAKRTKESFKQKVIGELKELKNVYISEYINLHSKARLGVEAEKKKNRIIKDNRIKTLSNLSTIDILQVNRLSMLQNKLAGLKACNELIKQTLDQTPDCPHCNFVPLNENIQISVEHVLSQLDEEIDKLLEEWIQSLIDNLSDPTTQDNLNLLKKEQKKLIDEFLKSKELPENELTEFVKAAKEALSGLAKIVIKREEITKALSKGGIPATPSDIKKRFEEYLSELSKGKDQDKIRIVFEE